MSVAELYNRVVDLELRLGLQSEGMDYSDRLLVLLDSLDNASLEEAVEIPDNLDASALEDHLSRLQDMVGPKDEDLASQLEGTMEEVMSRIESQLKSAD